ncbi:hypothetical protein PVL29_024441 [Vitis rotundifolia]|uniref:Uncharacterized protein n=1 Tax=Vitis rotundifolia TaxID=103349 RepID=A0AA38YRY5_VITRO|nr:hypothetical protein PVL29_024441 [Vitis rotundifolia]
MVRWWGTTAGHLRTLILNRRSLFLSSSPPTAVGQDQWKIGVKRKHLLITKRKQIQAILKSVEPEFLLYNVSAPETCRTHKDKVTRKVLNLVFTWADEGSELKFGVPLVFKGEGLDVSNLDTGDRILMHAVEVHPSLKLLSKNETMPVCKIVQQSWRKQNLERYRHLSTQYEAFGIHIGSTHEQAVRE